MLKLKSLELKSGVIQSPMAGCTDLAFRLIAREHGMEFAFLEMVSAEALVRDNEKTKRLLKTAAQDRPLGAQIVGCNPDVMGQAAAIVEEMGFDLLDINCGCPVPKITAPGGGSALLREPDTATKIFESVMNHIKKIPVTVKMRLGYSDASGEEAIKIAKSAEISGLSAVTVHGRTRAQGYSGNADWQAIGRVKKELSIPVFGNGDLQSSEDAVRMLEISRVNGVMIGRGGLGNPWIYRSIEAALSGNSFQSKPTLDEIKSVILKHLELEIEHVGEKMAVLKFRRIACWYFKNLPGVAEFRAKINVAASAQEMRELIRNFKLSF